MKPQLFRFRVVQTNARSNLSTKSRYHQIYSKIHLFPKLIRIIFWTPHSFEDLLMRDLWIWGITPPPAIVPLMRVSSSSSPRIASCRCRGVIRFTFRSLLALPANSNTSAVKYSRMAAEYTAAVAPTLPLAVTLDFRSRWIRPTGNCIWKIYDRSKLHLQKQIKKLLNTNRSSSCFVPILHKFQHAQNVDMYAVRNSNNYRNTLINWYNIGCDYTWAPYIYFEYELKGYYHALPLIWMFNFYHEVSDLYDKFMQAR